MNFPYQIWVGFFLHTRNLRNSSFKPVFEYKITFWICVLMLGIHKGYCVVKTLVWNVRIKVSRCQFINVIGISISKISGPVPERKYFPSKGSQDSQWWPHQQPGFNPYHETGVGGGSNEPEVAFRGGDGEPPIYANDPNVIMVDTNSLPTRWAITN